VLKVEIEVEGSRLSFCPPLLVVGEGRSVGVVTCISFVLVMVLCSSDQGCFEVGWSCQVLFIICFDCGDLWGV
jgi:hypothetical protein